MLITQLPEVVLVKVLSYLHWKEKLGLISAIPTVECYLQVAEAWPCFVFVLDDGTTMDEYYRAENCVKKYGRFIQSFRTYIYNVQDMDSVSITSFHGSMFKIVSQHCCHLKSFHLQQVLDGYRCGQHSTYEKDLDDALLVLTKCKTLKNVTFFLPCETDMQPRAYLLMRLIGMNVTGLVSVLDLSNISWKMSKNQMSYLLSFQNLRELSIQKWNIDANLILEMSKRSLLQLNIFQEEEMLDVEVQPTDNVWEKVLKLKPDMKVNNIYDGVILLKTMFPAYMPLTELSLNDISNILTKGIMDHFADRYHGTLEAFRYMNLYHEQAHCGDNRLPFALVDLARKCSKLKTVCFDVPLSSTTVLLLACARKLKELRVIRDEVSYEFDWTRREGSLSLDMVQWLKDSGRSEISLEKTVSSLLGFSWKLWDPPPLPNVGNTSF